MKTVKSSNPIRINRLQVLIIGMMLVLSLQGKGQSQSKNSLLQMIDQDRSTIDAIAGCDKKIHPDIFLVAQTPDLLNKIEELQKKSQDEFKAIIEKYDRDAQSAFYDMARYPNLISDLVSKGRPSNLEVGQIVLNYPEDIRDVTKTNTLKYFDVLLQIERLNIEIDKAFQYALEPYPAPTRESVNVLLGNPEIVSALLNDKAFTTLLGEVYREDPGWLTNRIDIISQELATNNRQDIEAYKDQIQKDPQAYNEMLEASEKFAKENNEVRYLQNYSDPIVETRVINSYPFWFGYPYWYSDPYWRPRPLYYHTGLYRNNYGNVVVVGLPSGFFLQWHSVYHPRLYPHLSYNYYNFYENHYMRRFRESPHSFSHHGFYRSIENNVIYNPRVNNRSLRKIDRKMGNNIVRRPNSFESASPGRGSSTITRPGGASGSRQGAITNGTVAPPRSMDRPNSRGSRENTNQRESNTVNPGRNEGNFNRRDPETRSTPARKEVNVSPGQQNNNRVSRSQQDNNRVSPDRQNNNRTPAGQQNNVRAAREKAQSKSSVPANRPKREKEKNRER